MAPGLAYYLAERLGLPVGVDDIVAYMAAVIAHPAYTREFRDQLQVPILRLPLTADPALCEQAVCIGEEVIWLHTYGERFADAAKEGPCVLRSCAKAFALRLRSRYQITKMRCPNRSHTIWTTAHLNSVTVVSLRCHLRSGRMMCRECEWSRNGSGTEKRTLPGSTLPRSTISTHLLGRCSTRGTYWLFSTFWDVLWSSNRYRLSCWLRYVKRHRSL